MKKNFFLDVDNNDRLSYRPEEENAIANTHSNEPDDDTFGPQSVPPEEEQVPEDPCMNTLEEGMTKSKQIIASNTEEERNNTSGGNDVSHVSQERNIEESTERQNNCEVPNDTVTVPRSGHGHFISYHFRSEDQRVRRMFRQFVNRSRPQSARSSDIVKAAIYKL
ncbi:unnamed protein product [Onchocerca flexuosa]|uniref:Uncharacterized protein n=1 Tax=Onchocerca flexuosa TaxID=387005 RepID=A0A183HUD3_9BILA|nr:unnamed protein product [Onchocerca flexuosa]